MLFFSVLRLQLDTGFLNMLLLERTRRLWLNLISCST